MASLAALESRPSLAETVYDRLVDAVCGGAIPPGEILRQERLAEELGVSRQPIIQALGMLRRDGLLEPAGRRGYKVAPVSADLVRQVYELRRAFDALAARRAAERSDGACFELMDRALDSGRHAIASGDVAALVDADVDFHRAIYMLSGNALLPDASAAIWRQVRRVMHAVLEKQAIRAAVWREHESIADAIRAGNADRAEALAGAHTDDAARRLVAWLEGGGPDGRPSARPMRIGSIR